MLLGHQVSLGLETKEGLVGSSSTHETKNLEGRLNRLLHANAGRDHRPVFLPQKFQELLVLVGQGRLELLVDPEPRGIVIDGFIVRPGCQVNCFPNGTRRCHRSLCEKQDHTGTTGPTAHERHVDCPSTPNCNVNIIKLSGSPPAPSKSQAKP